MARRGGHRVPTQFYQRIRCLQRRFGLAIEIQRRMMADEHVAAAGPFTSADAELNESDLPVEPRERKRVLNVLAQRRYRKRSPKLVFPN
jgi:hypothetical protein